MYLRSRYSPDSLTRVFAYCKRPEVFSSTAPLLHYKRLAQYSFSVGIFIAILSLTILTNTLEKLFIRLKTPVIHEPIWGCSSESANSLLSRKLSLTKYLLLWLLGW